MTQPIVAKDSSGIFHQLVVGDDGVLQVAEQEPLSSQHAALMLFADGTALAVNKARSTGTHSEIVHCADYAAAKTLFIRLTSTDQGSANVNVVLQGSLTGGYLDDWFDYATVGTGAAIPILNDIDMAATSPVAGYLYVAIPVTIRAPYLKLIAWNTDAAVAATIMASIAVGAI